MRVILFILTLLLAASPLVAQQPVPPPPDAPAEPPPDAAATSWWVSEQGKTSAKSYSLPEMTVLMRAGTLTPESYVFRVGGAGWVKANADAALQAVFRTQPPAPPKNEVFERLMTGIWRMDEDPLNGFAIWYVATYRADGRVFSTQFTSLEGFPPTQMSLTGTWKVEAGAQANEFILNQSIAGANSSITFRMIDQNTLENTASGKTTYRVQ